MCSLCRWPEAHHQVEAMGSFGGAVGKVWMGPWGCRGFCRLSAPHAWTRPWEASHCSWMPAPPLARPLVTLLNHCSPFFLSCHMKDCNISLSSLSAYLNSNCTYLFVCGFLYVLPEKKNFCFPGGFMSWDSFPEAAFVLKLGPPLKFAQQF